MPEESLSSTPKSTTAKSTTTEPDPPPPDLNPPDDAEFVSEELPANFWDREPIPHNDDRIDSELSADSFFDAPPDQPPPKLAPKAEKKEPTSAQESSPKPAAPKQPKGEGRFGTPMFGELESLFPGRVVKVEEHPQEDTEEILSEADDDEDAAELSA